MTSLSNYSAATFKSDFHFFGRLLFFGAMGRLGCFWLFALLDFCLAAEMGGPALLNCRLRSSSAMIFSFSRASLLDAGRGAWGSFETMSGGAGAGPELLSTRISLKST